MLGYQPAVVMEQLDNTSFKEASRVTTHALTHVMVLHPICFVLAFIAFLFGLCPGIFGSILSALVAAMAWILTLVVMITDFTLFGVWSKPSISRLLNRQMARL
jgi:hypothetical protein